MKKNPGNKYNKIYDADRLKFDESLKAIQVETREKVVALWNKTNFDEATPRKIVVDIYADYSYDNPTYDGFVLDNWAITLQAKLGRSLFRWGTLKMRLDTWEWYKVDGKYKKRSLNRITNIKYTIILYCINSLLFIIEIPVKINRLFKK